MTVNRGGVGGNLISSMDAASGSQQRRRHWKILKPCNCDDGVPCRYIKVAETLLIILIWWWAPLEYRIVPKKQSSSWLLLSSKAVQCHLTIWYITGLEKLNEMNYDAKINIGPIIKMCLIEINPKIPHAIIRNSLVIGSELWVRFYWSKC